MSLTSEDREAIGGSIAVGYYDHTAAEKTAAVVEQIVARHVAEARAAALNEAAEVLRTEAAEAWGGGAQWLTTGKHAAYLAAGWVANLAANPPP